MKFNPYQPPQSTLSTETSLQYGHLYLVANYVYAALLIAFTCILFIGGPPPLDVRGIFVGIFFYAPLICFCQLRWGSVRHLKKLFVAYGLLVLALFAIFYRNLASSDPDPGVGAVIVGINVLALVGALAQVRLTRRSTGTAKQAAAL